MIAVANFIRVRMRRNADGSKTLLSTELVVRDEEE